MPAPVAVKNMTSIALVAGERLTAFQTQQGQPISATEIMPRFEAAAVRQSGRIVARNDDNVEETSIDDTAIKSAAVSIPPRSKEVIGFEADAALAQIWEGTVLSVNHKEGFLSANLRPKNGQIEAHVGNIYFEWVMEQDRELVGPGAVFYLTIYKSRKPGGTIVNSQELRFRRLPAWTKSQVSKIDQLAAQLAKKMKARPEAK